MYGLRGDGLEPLGSLEGLQAILVRLLKLQFFEAWYFGWCDRGMGGNCRDSGYH